MSISDGQRVRALESNAAWVSKTTDSTVTGKITLDRAASGDEVTDVQQDINDLKADVIDLEADVTQLESDVAALEAMSFMVYKGVWNAATNTPTLTNGTGRTGDFYRVGTAGTVNFGAGNITFVVGDKVAYNDIGIWEKWDVDDTGLLVAANNLSDLTSASTARTNLGLGTAALNNTGDFDAAGSAASAQSYAIQRANHTGTQLAATISDFNSAVATTALLKANNLSDVANASTAINNILPSQTGNSGKFLSTNGTVASWQTSGGTITGPGSSTDNAVTRWDGTGGSVIQNSNVIIDDSGNFSTPGSIYSGSGTVDASAVLQADSTTKGMLPPRMTTAQRDAIVSPAIGLVIYNTDTSALNLYNGGWGAVGGSTAATGYNKNYLINGNFDFWQRNTSLTVANGASTYVADRWYVKNSLGTNGVITFSRVTGVSLGSKYGASVQITTAPTAAQANGTELFQTIENFESLELYNQSISASVRIKALGNVNQVGIQFYYKTTEAKVDTTLGSEQLVTVNTSTFTLGSLLNQSVGSSPTLAGVVGIRIRVTGVSSGNLYALNNGFIVEQAMVNLGSTASSFYRHAINIAEEMKACQRFYEKSYRQSIAAGTNTGDGRDAYYSITASGSGTRHFVTVFYKSTKRTENPTVTLWDLNGTINTVTELTNANGTVANGKAVGIDLGDNQFIAKDNTTNGNVAGLYFSWASDSEI